MRSELSTWVTLAYAIIASGENFPDALSAAGLAGAYFCPLLLVRKDSVPQATADALASLGVKEIIIVGGTAAVSDAVMDELGEAYDTGRIWGDDRYETAANVADEITRRVGPTFAGSAFVARGDAFPDALAVSPLAYRASMYGGGMPILLTRPGDLPASTADAIDALGISAAYVIGGEGAVSSATKTALDALLVANGGTASERLYGDDRYATAVAVAEAGPDHDWGWWQNVGIATGANFPDALAGGPVMGMQNGVLLLTAPTALSPATATALGTHVPDIQSVTVFGGPSAVSETVLGLISAALQPKKSCAYSLKKVMVPSALQRMMALFALAVWRPRWGAWLSPRGWIIWGGLVLPTLVLPPLVVVSLIAGERLLPGTPVPRIEAEATHTLTVLPAPADQPEAFPGRSSDNAYAFVLTKWDVDRLGEFVQSLTAPPPPKAAEAGGTQ